MISGNIWDGVLDCVSHNPCLQAYYSSVSCGYSISEAVGFAPPDWVVLGSKRYKVSSVRLSDNKRSERTVCFLCSDICQPAMTLRSLYLNAIRSDPIGEFSKLVIDFQLVFSHCNFSSFHRRLLFLFFVPLS